VSDLIDIIDKNTNTTTTHHHRARDRLAHHPHLCHPLPTPTPAAPVTLTTPVPSQTPHNNDSEGTGASLITPHLTASALSPPQHIGAPLHLQHHSRHHPATPVTALPQHNTSERPPHPKVTHLSR